MQELICCLTFNFVVIMEKRSIMMKIALCLPLVLMMLVPLKTAADDYVRGDVDEDGAVGIADVTCLVDYLLSGSWDDEPGQPEYETFTVNGISFKMIYVEGGTFTMGATFEQTNASENEKPAHRVTLSSYYIGEFEVTQELYLAVVGSNPSSFIGAKLPVERVTWANCQTFATKLSQLTGRTFKLPTEAQWEYAARGGKFSQGFIYPGSNNVNEVAWHPGNSSSKTHEVGQKLPNELGIYDMAGNVSEWCQDWYGASYYSSSPENNPTGPASGSYRVERGSGYSANYGSGWCRVSWRGSKTPTYSYKDLGFRVVLVP